MVREKYVGSIKWNHIVFTEILLRHLNTAWVRSRPFIQLSFQALWIACIPDLLLVMNKIISFDKHRTWSPQKIRWAITAVAGKEGLKLDDT